MHKKRYKTEAAGDSMPRLVQVIHQLAAVQKQGLTDHRLEEEYRELLNDKGGCDLAMLFASDMDRLRHMLEFREKRVQAIEEELKRTDLTPSEGLRLWMALHEVLKETTTTILQEQERKNKPRPNR